MLSEAEPPLAAYFIAVISAKSYKRMYNIRAEKYRNKERGFS